MLWHKKCPSFLLVQIANLWQKKYFYYISMFLSIECVIKREGFSLWALTYLPIFKSWFQTVGLTNVSKALLIGSQFQSDERYRVVRYRLILYCSHNSSRTCTFWMAQHGSGNNTETKATVQNLIKFRWPGRNVFVKLQKEFYYCTELFLS